MSDWYYEKSGDQVGPVSEEDLRAAAINCEIREESLVWNISFGNTWKPIKYAGLDNLIFGAPIKPIKPVGPPPLPTKKSVSIIDSGMSDLVSEVRNTSKKHEPSAKTTDEFMNSPLTGILVGRNFDLFRSRWSHILKKSPGGPGKLHQVSSWNEAAFIFTFIWFAYRKMYKLAMIFLIIEIFLWISLNDAYMSKGFIITIFIVLMLIAGLYGNSIYLQHIFNQFVETNRISDRATAESIALSRGGTSWLNAIIIMVGALILKILLTLAIGVGLNS